MERAHVGSGAHGNPRSDREVVMAQVYTAFGQGTGEIRVSRDACAELARQIEPHMEKMLESWDTQAVQVLERVRAIGRGVRQASVARFDTVARAADVLAVAPRVKEVSKTDLCSPPPDDPDTGFPYVPEDPVAVEAKQRFDRLASDQKAS